MQKNYRKLRVKKIVANAFFYWNKITIINKTKFQSKQNYLKVQLNLLSLRKLLSQIKNFPALVVAFGFGLRLLSGGGYGIRDFDPPFESLDDVIDVAVDDVIDVVVDAGRKHLPEASMPLHSDGPAKIILLTFSLLTFIWNEFNFNF